MHDIQELSGVRTGGFGGQHPPIENFKGNENLSFGNEPRFFIQR